MTQPGKEASITLGTSEAESQGRNSLAGREGGGSALSPSAAPNLAQAWDPLTQRATLSPEKGETQEGRKVGRRLEVKF